MGMPVEQYVLKAVSGVRAGDLEQAILVLPFSDALRLLHYLGLWLQQGSQVGTQLYTYPRSPRLRCCAQLLRLSGVICSAR
jgi:hypothetical protein